MRASVSECTSNGIDRLAGSIHACVKTHILRRESDDQTQ